MSRQQAVNNQERSAPTERPVTIDRATIDRTVLLSQSQPAASATTAPSAAVTNEAARAANTRLTQATFKTSSDISQGLRMSMRHALSQRGADARMRALQQVSPRYAPNYVPTSLDRFITWLAQRLRTMVDRLLNVAPQKLWILELLKRRHAERLARENARRIAEKAKSASPTPAIKR